MDDLISRQAAIEALEEQLDYLQMLNKDENPTAESKWYGVNWAKNTIADFPSEQPEIIRCKDCKWWDKSEDSPFGYCMAMKHGYMSANWEIGIYRRYKDDFYCADAERKDNG